MLLNVSLDGMCMCVCVCVFLNVVCKRMKRVSESVQDRSVCERDREKERRRIRRKSTLCLCTCARLLHASVGVCSKPPPPFTHTYTQLQGLACSLFFLKEPLKFHQCNAICSRAGGRSVCRRERDTQ